MNRTLIQPAVFLFSLSAFGCSSQSNSYLAPRGPATAGPGPSPSAVALSLPAQAPGTPVPERIVLPADYHLILLDGGLALVRSTGAGGTPLHLSAEYSSANTTNQEAALLPQELAAEAARNRASTARMDLALQSVMQRSRELEDEAQKLGERSKLVADLLAQAQLKAPPVDLQKSVPGGQ